MGEVQTDDGTRAEAFSKATGIYFTGGDQARLLQGLQGSRTLEALRAAYANGAVVAGTSAGCTVLGEIALAGGGDTVAAIARAGVAEKFGYLSMAGRAFLEYLEGRELPGVAALTDAEPATSGVEPR